MSLRFNAHQASGSFTGGATAFVGPTIAVGGANKRVESLSAHVVATIATNSLTLTPKWQGSFDGVTWFDLAAAPNAPAGVAAITGPVAAKAVALPAPDSAYSQKYVRAVLAAGAATGAGTDALGVGYSYRQSYPTG